MNDPDPPKCNEGERVTPSNRPTFTVDDAPAAAKIIDDFLDGKNDCQSESLLRMSRDILRQVPRREPA